MSWQRTGFGGQEMARPDAYPLTDRWVLSRIMESTSGAGGYWLIFKRCRGEGITIRVSGAGKVSILRHGLVQGMKKKRRERVTSIAHQAVAYCVLMGTLEGSPEHDQI